MKHFYGSIWLLFALCTSASAALIVPPYVFFGGVNGSASSGPPNLNVVENVFNAASPWGVSLDLLAGTPAITYEVIKTVTNNTGTTWSSFGFGLDGTSMAVPPVLPVLTLLGTPSIAGSGVGSAIGSPGGNNQYGWSNVSIAPGQTITVRFAMQTCGNCAPATGVISQSAAGYDIPEPGSFALLGSSLLAIAALLRRRSPSL